MVKPTSTLLSFQKRRNHFIIFIILLLSTAILIYLRISFHYCDCIRTNIIDSSMANKSCIPPAIDNLEKSPMDFMKSKLVLLVSHELSLSGGPLLLMEFAFLLRKVGANVVWVTYQKPAEENAVIHNLEHKMINRGVQLLNAKGQEAIETSLKADIIVLNTAVSGKWLDAVLKNHLSEVLPKILWWIHEMRGHYFRMEYVKHLPFVAAAMIDSNTTAEYWKNRTHDRLGIQMPRIYAVHLGNNRELMEIAEDFTARSVFREHIRESLGVGTDDLLFAIINSVSRGKGQDLFLQAFNESLGLIRERKAGVPAIHAVVVGSDMNAQTKFEGELRNFAVKQGIQDRVHFVNKTLTVSPYLAAIDVLVQNSQARGECFGRITIEAMAFQLPILGTEAGGTREIVVDGVTGLLHPVGKDGVSRLAENIARLAGNAEMRLTLGKAGYMRVKERFMEHHMAARIASVLIHVLHNSKHDSA